MSYQRSALIVTFITNFMAFSQSQLEGAQTSTGGWIFIAVAWTVIAAMWLATSYSSRVLRNYSSKSSVI
jgi:hypothetical protein